MASSRLLLSRSILFCLCLLLVHSISIVQSRRVIRATSGEETTGSYIVVLTPDTNHTRFETIVDKVKNESVDHNITEKVEGPFAKIIAAKISEEAAHRLKHEEGVDFIEEETYAYATSSEVDSWAIDRIDQIGSALDNSSFTPCECGEGVDIYVLDTGINYGHFDFQKRASYPGYDPVDEVERTTQRGRDCNGHGTRVASLAAGRVYGVARCATVYSVRVLGCQNGGAWSVVIRGLTLTANDIIKRQRPAVILMSLGGPFTLSVNNVTTNIVNRGIPVVVASGSDRDDACRYTPSGSTGAITVAGMARGDRIYYNTNGGSCVDIFAPAVYITSASSSCTTCKCTTRYTGTSMSAAMVAGAVALLLEKEPKLSPANITKILKADCVRNALDFSSLPSNLRATTDNCLLHVRSCACNLTTVTSTSTVTQTQTMTSTRPVNPTPTGPCCDALFNSSLQNDFISNVNSIAVRGIDNITDIVSSQLCQSDSVSSTLSSPTFTQTLILTPSCPIVPFPTTSIVSSTILSSLPDLSSIPVMSSSPFVSPSPMFTVVNTSCANLTQYFPSVKSGYHNITTSSGENSTVYCELERAIRNITGFQRIAYIDMSANSNTNCPQNLSLRLDRQGQLRTCQRLQEGRGCSSVTFSSSGVEYTRVCGRIRGYQWASPNAFYNFQINRDYTVMDRYVDGVVLSYVNGTSHQHIWTFAAALDGTDRTLPFVCQCTNKNVRINFQVPSFVGDDYFCETGSRGRFRYGTLYTDDPLWDGQGCSETDTCCEKGEWFCKDVPKTNSSIELRLCGNEPRYNEDTPLELIELYVQ